MHPSLGHQIHKLKKVWLSVLCLVWVAVVLLAYYEPTWRWIIGLNKGKRIYTVIGFKELIFFIAVALGVFLLVFVIDIFLKTKDLDKRIKLRLGSFLGGLLVGVLVWIASQVDVYSLEFPAAQEAMKRAASAILGAGLVFLAALGCGSLFIRIFRWNFNDRQEGLLFCTSAGVGVISYLSLLLAANEIFTIRAGRYLMVFLALVSLIYLFLLLRRLPDSRPSIPNSLEPGARSNLDWVWKSIILLSLMIALIGALAPEIEYDALWYHLWLPKVWLTQGQPVDLISEYVSLYPLQGELVYANALSIGGDVAAKLVNFTWFVLTALLVFQFTRRFFPPVSPWLATAIFVTFPTVLWEATTAYIDILLAFYTGLAIYALLCYVENHSWQWLFLTAINFGLALSTKHLGWFALLISSVGLVIYIWLREKRLRKAIGPALFIIGLSILFAIPWYFRSYTASGNPFFPEFYYIFGANPLERWDGLTQRSLDAFFDHFGRPRTLLNQITLSWDMTIHSYRYGGTLGPMTLLILPGVLLAWKTSRAGRWLMALIFFFVVLWASPMSSFQLRFLVAITPLLAVIIAYTLSIISVKFRIRKWSTVIFTALLVGILLGNLPPWVALHQGDWNETPFWLTHVVRKIPLDVVTGKVTQKQYLSSNVASYAAWDYINNNLPEDALILTFSGGDHYYSERSRLWSDSTLARPAVWGANVGQERKMLNALDNLGVDYILFDKEQLTTKNMASLAITQPEVIDRWYDLAYEDKNFILYSLRWEQYHSE
jgi:hypothetical protein